MFQIITMNLIIIIAILCVGGASSKESVIKGRNKSKNKIAKPKNLCSLEPSELNNIRCVCTREKFQRASSAECWIFGPVTKEHFIWELIVKTQPYLSDLNIVASNQGYLKDIPQEFVQNMLLLKNFTISFAVLDQLEKFTFGNSTSLEVGIEWIFNSHSQKKILFHKMLRSTNTRMNFIKNISVANFLQKKKP